MAAPAEPKVYHILHVDRLASVVDDGWLWCDAELVNRGVTGTVIGMSRIKRRRLSELMLSSHPGLHVGSCVPFYFCPRSVMLYLIHRANHPELEYRGGQGPIVHLEADVRAAVAWAGRNGRRWAVTLQNAGGRYFDDRSDLESLDLLRWDAIEARDWAECKEEKQAEFLMERSFPWDLIERVGVHDRAIGHRVRDILRGAGHNPRVEVRSEWYY